MRNQSPASPRVFRESGEDFFPDHGNAFHSLIGNLDGMVYRCRADLHWSMEFVSDGCLLLTGYAPGDLLTNNHLYHETIACPQDRGRAQAEILLALKQGRRYSVEYRIMHRDGSVRWVWDHGAGMTDMPASVPAIEGLAQDITQRKAAEQALHEAERRYRSIFENAVEGIFQSTPDKGYLTVNPALARMYGYDSPSVMIATLQDIQHQLYVDPRRRTDFLEQMALNGQVVSFESEVYQRDGNIIWISENARAVLDRNGAILFFEGTVVDITNRKLYEASIRHQATHDGLTGLPNRSLLQDRLQQAMEHAKRSGDRIGVVFIDLDHFKFINDSLGHQAGDELLKAVAMRLTSCIRASDTVARQGGDEFVLILGGHRTMEGLTDTVQRILAAVATPWTFNGLELHITCSAGVCVYPDDGGDAPGLFRNADLAMYKAKKLGRNSFEYFAAQMNSQATDRLTLLHALRTALSAQEFILHYQPRIDLKTGAVVGAEALVRWRTQSGALVMPGTFIPLAEDSGMITAIGEWVLRTACARQVAWQKKGFAPVALSVNLSPRQLVRGDIVQLVADVLQSTGLDPCCLELEVTETVVMRDVERSLSTLSALNALGVDISIDDFGTGYSSLSYLKRLPVDVLKIDRTFVSDLTLDQDSAAIIKAVISLAHNLNLKVVAEGVENAAQLSFLSQNGCDGAQGYFLGRPLPEADFLNFLGQQTVGPS